MSDIYINHDTNIFLISYVSFSFYCVLWWVFYFEIVILNKYENQLILFIILEKEIGLKNYIQNYVKKKQLQEFHTHSSI